MAPKSLSKIAGTAVPTIPVIMYGTGFVGGFVDLQTKLQQGAFL